MKDFMDKHIAEVEEMKNDLEELIKKVTVDDFVDDVDDDPQEELIDVPLGELIKKPLMVSSDMINGKFGHSLFSAKKTAEQKYQEYLYYTSKDILKGLDK